MSKGGGKWSLGKGSEVNWSEVKWSEESEVMILDEICVLSMIYIYVAVSSFCAVRCLIIFRLYL
jgi:hypothetical protein